MATVSLARFSQHRCLLPRSGGGNDVFGGPYAGGNGGGLVRIVAQTLQLDGIIKANRGSAMGDNGGGGSGGGIRIDVATLQGAGQINANGGEGWLLIRVGPA